MTVRYPLPIETICSLIVKHTSNPALTEIQIRTMQASVEGPLDKRIIEAIEQTDFYKMQRSINPEMLKKKSKRSPLEDLLNTYYNSKTKQNDSIKSN